MSSGLKWYPLQTEVRIVTADVPNPDFDARCKRDYRSVRFIKAGTIFRVEQQECEFEGFPESRKLFTNHVSIGFSQIQAKISVENGAADEFIDNPLVVALLANSEPLKNVKASFLKSHTEDMKAIDFAKVAVDHGLLTLEQIDEIIKYWQNQD